MPNRALACFTGGDTSYAALVLNVDLPGASNNASRDENTAISLV